MSRGPCSSTDKQSLSISLQWLTAFAPVVQRIEQETPKLWIEVRLLSGVPFAFAQIQKAKFKIMEREKYISEEEIASPEKLPLLADSEKYGNDEEISRALEEGEILRVINIDEVRPELKDRHQNVVELADIEVDKRVFDHINEAMVVEIRAGDKILQGIFKPAIGENREVKDKLKIHDCYLRERAAYLVDRFFSFGLVPPTVVREIEGKGIGSLQLYIPPEVADSAANISDQIDGEKEQKSEEWLLMAVLDYLIANWERKPDNWLINKNDNSKLYAIDHGYAFYSAAVEAADRFELRGPRLNLTFDNKTKKLIQTPIPEEILERLKEKLAQKEELISKLRGIVPNQEIENLVKRTENLIERKY